MPRGFLVGAPFTSAFFSGTIIARNAGTTFTVAWEHRFYKLKLLSSRHVTVIDKASAVFIGVRRKKFYFNQVQHG